MLKSISWGLYLEGLLIAAAIYYLLVVVIHFKKPLRRFLLGEDNGFSGQKRDKRRKDCAGTVNASAGHVPAKPKPCTEKFKKGAAAEPQGTEMKLELDAAMAASHGTGMPQEAVDAVSAAGDFSSHDGAFFEPVDAKAIVVSEVPDRAAVATAEVGSEADALLNNVLDRSRNAKRKGYPALFSDEN